MLIKSKSKKKPPLPEASSANSFWVYNGPVLRNLRELKNFLEVITVEQFNYHTKRDGNDFASWVSAVLHEVALGQTLKKAKTIATSLAAVKKVLSRYDG